MKGIELPINILVIVAVAVIVLLGIVALFMIGFSPFGTMTSQQAIKNEACTLLVNSGCDLDPKNIELDFDANKDGVIAQGTAFTWDDLSTEENEALGDDNIHDNLASLCAFYYSKFTELDCKQLCGCY